MSRKEYDLGRYYSRRQMCIEKLGGKCIDCSSVILLQFDHINPEDKLYDISAIILHGDDKLFSELEKCVLRCYPCHKVRTSAQQRVPHGGGLTGRKNCPCAPCKLRKSEYMKEYHRTHFRMRRL